MKQQQTMDITGAALLIGFAVVLAFNQVVIKVTNDAFQPAFQAGLRSVGAIVFDLGLDDVESQSVRLPRRCGPWGHGRVFVCC